MKKIVTAALCLLAAAGSAEARYIDYPGGWTVMQMNDGYNNALHVHHSPTSRYSVGYVGEYWRDDEWILNAGQLVWLLNRWNFTDAQANVYLRGGAGVARSDRGGFDDEYEPAGFGGVMLDAEDRRFYVSYENAYTHAGEIEDGFFQQKARVGFAPYVAEYGALHTWFMLQVEHRPDGEDEVVFTPMIRVFKGDVLVEVGYGDNEKILFNLMLRF